MTEQPAEEPDRQDVKAAWSEAGERLGGLGSRLKQHYQQHAEAPAEQTGADVKDAAKRLNQAVHSAFEALASASKDQSVKDDARRAGRSVAEALGGTFAGISGELSRTFGGSSRSEPAKPGPASAPPPVSGPDAADPDYGSPERATPTDAPAGAADRDPAESGPPDDSATNQI